MGSAWEGIFHTCFNLSYKNFWIFTIGQLDEILKDRDRSKVMISHVDQLLVATAFQLRMAFSKHMGDEESSKNVIRMYRCLVALLVSVSETQSFSGLFLRGIEGGLN